VTVCPSVGTRPAFDTEGMKMKMMMSSTILVMPYQKCMEGSTSKHRTALGEKIGAIIAWEDINGMVNCILHGK